MRAAGCAAAGAGAARRAVAVALSLMRHEHAERTWDRLDGRPAFRPTRSLSATTAALGLVRDVQRMELKAGALVVRMPVADGGCDQPADDVGARYADVDVELEKRIGGRGAADRQPRAGRRRVREHQRAAATVSGKCAARREARTAPP